LPKGEEEAGKKRGTFLPMKLRVNSRAKKKKGSASYIPAKSRVGWEEWGKGKGVVRDTKAPTSLRAQNEWTV